MKGIDCTAAINAATRKALKESGYEFVCRYLVPASMAWKRLTKQEVQAITASGLFILSIFESSANRASSGASGGAADGKAALIEAKSVGQPEESAIYFAVDYDAQPKDYDALEAYFLAAKEQIKPYKIGGYGSYAVIEELFKRGVIDCGWQTYAWSKGKLSTRANVYQYKNGVAVAGINCDLNKSYGNEGFWKGEEPPMYKHILLGSGKMPQTVKLGSNGDHVKLLQQELNIAGFNCGNVDGVFGPKTLAAVKKFQGAAGLNKDGIVGPKTWDALLSIDVIELDPLQLSAKLVNSSGKTLLKTIKNFVNGNFFNYGNPNVTIGWLISEGKVLHDRHEYKIWKGQVKGTLLIFKDGTVKVAQMLDSEIAPIVDRIRFACQGFYLPASDDVKASIKLEGFNPDEVGYRCNRLGMGYNGKKINIVVQRFSDATRMQHAMDILGCAGRSICLDSGGSVNFVSEGKAIFTTSRVLTNILTW